MALSLRVCPAADGADVRLLLPTVSAQAMNLVLQEFARDVDAGPERQIILVLDQAGWHTRAEVVVPDGLHLELLPPYAPELQPAERLWTLTDEVVVNRHFATLDELQTTQAEQCLRCRSNATVCGHQSSFNGVQRLLESMTIYPDFVLHS